MRVVGPLATPHVACAIASVDFDGQFSGRVLIRAPTPHAIGALVARIHALRAARRRDGFSCGDARENASRREYEPREIACYTGRMKLDHLSDDALLAQLTACCVLGRKVDARVISYLIEVEERRIHLLRACSSMWDFATRKLGFSGGQAYRRIACARLVKRYPFILPLIENGFTHMSTLAQIHLFVGDDNVHALVADTAGKSRDAIDQILAERFGVRRKEKQERGVVYTDEELEGLIERARELTSHVIPDGDRLKMAKRAFRLLIADEERRTRATAERPRPAPPATSVATKSISRASTRAMFERHGEQCCYVDPKSGERCPSRVFIERDHRRMRAAAAAAMRRRISSRCAGRTIVCSPSSRWDVGTSSVASTFVSGRRSPRRRARRGLARSSSAARAVPRRTKGNMGGSWVGGAVRAREGREAGPMWAARKEQNLAGVRLSERYSV
jgi:hypothetical protein